MHEVSSFGPSRDLERDPAESKGCTLKIKKTGKDWRQPDLLIPEELLCFRAGPQTAQGGGIIPAMKGSQVPEDLGVDTLSSSSTNHF